MKSECPHGHRYTASNTYIRCDGRRICRTCLANRRNAGKKRQPIQPPPPEHTAFVIVAVRHSPHYAILDHNDVDRVARYTWRLRGKYPVTADKYELPMARLIVNAKRRFKVVHINGNPLDCRRANLQTKMIR